jgi:hypothetical protein
MKDFEELIHICKLSKIISLTVVKLSRVVCIAIKTPEKNRLQILSNTLCAIPESLAAHYRRIDVFTRHLRTYPAVYEIFTIASTLSSAFIHIHLELSSIMGCTYPAVTIRAWVERHQFGYGSHDPVAALFIVCGIKDQFNHS